MKEAQITLRLKPETRAALEKLAVADNRTLSAFVSIKLDEIADQAKARRK